VLYLSQIDYLKRVLERFNLKGAKSIITPLAQHFKLSKEQKPKSDEDIAYMQKVSYASANLQSIVALSTIEVEYITANDAVKKTLWLRGLVPEILPVKELKTIVIHCDNQSARVS